MACGKLRRRIQVLGFNKLWSNFSFRDLLSLQTVKRIEPNGCLLQNVLYMYFITTFIEMIVFKPNDRILLIKRKIC